MRTAHEYVVATLRAAILNGELPGGTRLVQSELADALGVSTTPVREALRDLAADGLVRLDAHRGAVVHRLNPTELDEICSLRMILEPEALRRAWPHLTDEVVAAVEALHGAMERASSAAEWSELNTRFHMSVYECAPSPRLLEILRGLVESWAMYVAAALQETPENRHRAAEGHDQILEALRTRDLEAALAATLEHVRITQEALAL
jgi:DNA-binding GntR family transcriptional regulator